MTQNEFFYHSLLSRHHNNQFKKPERELLNSFLADSLGLLFPQYRNYPISSHSDILSHASDLQRSLENLIKEVGVETNVTEISEAYIGELPKFLESIKLDAEAIYQEDPAAESVDEVIIAYPGFFAIAVYRFANFLQQLNLPLIPRILTEFAKERTGIDIHPSAIIGASFCIDHGTGVVIGGTSVIGDNVKIYQGVTLGGLSVKKSLANIKRHPTIQDRVVIYAGATILGGETIIGHNCVIGGNVWLTQSVPPNSKVYHRGDNIVKTDH